MTTVAEQDYIKAIFKLEELNGEATTSSLAASLGVTAASVSGMLKKLERTRMVRRRHYRGVHLTGKGRRSALAILRRHRLMELFLAEVLGMPWESVHQEAEKLEHVVSDDVLARIDRLLGFPERDPHGAPIPTPKGDLTAARGVPLKLMQAGQAGVVSEVEDDNPAMLLHLKEIGLIPGAKVSVTEILAVDGTRVLRCGNRKQTVSPKVAAAVRVVPEESG